MPRFDGTLALKLDFGSITTTAAPVGGRARAGSRLRLAQPPSREALRRAAPGPDKYAALERRRRQAQINARHLLGLMEGN